MEKPIKPDVWNNENPEELQSICQDKKRQDVGKRMLRIDINTHVLVDPDLCNPQYAEELKLKFDKARRKLH